MRCIPDCCECDLQTACISSVFTDLSSEWVLVSQLCVKLLSAPSHFHLLRVSTQIAMITSKEPIALLQSSAVAPAHPPPCLLDNASDCCWTANESVWNGGHQTLILNEGIDVITPSLLRPDTLPLSVRAGQSAVPGSHNKLQLAGSVAL